MHLPAARLLRLAAPIAVVAALVAAPRAAHAQFRASAYGGVEHLRSDGQGYTLVQYRGEATFGFLPWFHAGAYAQGLSPTFDGKLGWGAGAVAAFRPALPGTPIDPMAFATLGYQSAPTGTGLRNALTVELGVGLVWHAFTVLDLELRGTYVGLTGSSGLNGFAIAAGLSLHL